MKPVREVFEHMATSAGAQALAGGGLVLTLFGGAGMAVRTNPNTPYLLFTGLTAVTGLVALGLGLAAWASAISDQLEVSRRRVRLGVWWVLASVAALILALIAA